MGIIEYTLPDLRKFLSSRLGSLVYLYMSTRGYAFTVPSTQEDLNTIFKKRGLEIGDKFFAAEHIYAIGDTQITWLGGSAGGGATALNELSDVTLASPTNLQILQYELSSGQWKNVTPPYEPAGSVATHAALPDIHHAKQHALNSGADHTGSIDASQHGDLSASAAAHHQWASITGKPTSFPPSGHFASHERFAGTDQIRLNQLADPITPNVPSLNSNVSRQGLLPQLSGNANEFLNGAGAFAVPAYASGDVIGPASNTDDYIPQWNGTDTKTLKNGLDPNALSAVEVKIRAVKASAGTLNPGQVVHAAGWNVGLSVPQVELADSSNSALMPAIGIVETTITNSTIGSIVLIGSLSGINTSAWTEGTILYVGSAGSLVNARPTGTAIVQAIAEVIRSNVTTGVLSVYASDAPYDLPNLSQDNLWIGDANAHPVETTLTSVRNHAPQAHATTHQNGGTDEVAVVTPAANAIPKADGLGKLDAGWIPDGAGGFTRDHLNGLNLTWTSVSQITIGVGQCRSDADDDDIQVNSPVIVDITTSGANGLDTGTESASTWYYIWLAKGASGVCGLISASSTAPTLPSGYDQSKRRIGSVRNNASSNLLNFRQYGAERQKEYRYWEQRDTQLRVITDGQATTWTDISLATRIPPTTRLGYIAAINRDGSDRVQLRPKGHPSTIGTVETWDSTANMFCIETDAAQAIQYQYTPSSPVTGLDVDVLGYLETV